MEVAMSAFSSEVIKTIGEVFRSAFPQLESNQKPSTGGQPASNVFGFVGNLFTSPGLLAFLGGCRPESAALRGSLVGLASGVEAVTEEDATGKTTVKRQPLSAALTIFVYVVGGILAALIFRRIRQAARIAAS